MNNEQELLAEIALLQDSKEVSEKVQKLAASMMLLLQEKASFAGSQVSAEVKEEEIFEKRDQYIIRKDYLDWPLSKLVKLVEAQSDKCQIEFIAGLKVQSKPTSTPKEEKEEWISVEDRLPAHEEKVFVAVKKVFNNASLGITLYPATFFEKHRDRDKVFLLGINASFYHYTYCTYWIPQTALPPLPAPQKQAEQNDKA